MTVERLPTGTRSYDDPRDIEVLNNETNGSLGFSDGKLRDVYASWIISDNRTRIHVGPIIATIKSCMTRVYNFAQRMVHACRDFFSCFGSLPQSSGEKTQQEAMMVAISTPSSTAALSRSVLARNT